MKNRALLKNSHLIKRMIDKLLIIKKIILDKLMNLKQKYQRKLIWTRIIWIFQIKWARTGALKKNKKLKTKIVIYRMNIRNLSKMEYLENFKNPALTWIKMNKMFWTTASLSTIHTYKKWIKFKSKKKMKHFWMIHHSNHSCKIIKYSFKTYSKLKGNNW